jgi:transaldolase/glucose-6-phosphate isomerase
MSVLGFHLGAVSAAYKHNLEVLAQTRAVARLWQRDLSLWPTYRTKKGGAAEQLNWLDLPGQLEPTVAQVAALASKLSGVGIQDVIFLSVSSSSLAAELIPALGLPTRGVRFHVVSRLEPSGLRSLERNLDFARTLFIVVSKSGKNLEVHALLLYFLAKVKAAGIVSPGANFVAVTENGSYLASLAMENRFQAVISDPHGFSGRFSGVQHYGLLLAGLCGLDLSQILAGLDSVQQECVRQEPVEQNPAAKIGAFLAALTQSGFHRLLFRAPPTLVPVARRLAHLVGCSSCKDGKGILPFVEYTIPDSQILNSSFAVCNFTWQKETPVAPLPADAPSIACDLANAGSIPGEIFKWEIAVSLACSLLGVNPFEDPDHTDARTAAMNYIGEISSPKKSEAPRPRIVEGSLSLFVEGDLRHDVSSISLEHALASFLALCAPDGYCAFLNFLWDTPEITERIATLVAKVGAGLGVPTHLAPGPRYLHLAGQCYKGGPRGGIALMLTGDSVERINLPGAGYTLADLRLALALGDMDVMVGRGRPIVRLHLAGTPETSLAELESVLLKAINARRKTR